MALSATQHNNFLLCTIYFAHIHILTTTISLNSSKHRLVTTTVNNQS